MKKMIIYSCLLIVSLLQYAYGEVLSDIKNHWDGNSYSNNALLQGSWADEFFFNNYNFNGQEKVLDIGCGNGKTSAKLAQKARNVLGIDKSSAMIQKAQNSYSNLSNINFIQQDAQDQSFYKKHQNEFDIVTSFLALHWAKDQKTVLNGIYISLKPKGRAFIKLSSKSWDPVQEIADKLINDDKYKANFKNFIDPMVRFSVDEYKVLIDEAGLKLVSIYDREEKDKLQNKEALIAQIKSWLPHYHHLKEIKTDLAERYIKELADLYVADFVKGNNDIILYDHYLEVIAEKS